MTSAITVERTGAAAQHTTILRVALITFPPLSHHTLYPWQWLLTQGEICLPGGTVVKNLPVNAGDARDKGSTPRSGSFPEVGNVFLPPVFLPGKFHGQRSLTGYSPRGCSRVEDNRGTELGHPQRCRLCLGREDSSSPDTDDEWRSAATEASQNRVTGYEFPRENVHEQPAPVISLDPL